MEIPKTLDEAVDILMSMEKLTPDNLDTRSLRNGWKLWAGSELAQWFYCHKIYHADDMSGIVQDAFRCRLKGETLDLNKEIERYHNHWKKDYGDDHLNIMRGHVIEHLSKMRDEKIDKIISKI
jgi:hypothetical protein